MEKLNISIQQKRKLVIFDFDNTVIDCNSDTVIHDLIEDKTELKEMYKKCENNQWTKFMNQTFEYMYSSLKVTVENLKQVQQSEKVQLTEGMEQLFKYLQENNRLIDVIIISDSNTLFIDWILEKFNLQSIFSNVFTNKGYIDENNKDLLRVDHYHEHNCTKCPPNICKKEVLQQFLNKKSQQKILYDQMFYIGDGGNDFCPLTELQKDDIIFARQGFSLEKILQKQENIENLVCEIVFWQNADEIQQNLKKSII